MVRDRLTLSFLDAEANNALAWLSKQRAIAVLADVELFRVDETACKQATSNIFIVTRLKNLEQMLTSIKIYHSLEKVITCIRNHITTQIFVL